MNKYKTAKIKVTAMMMAMVVGAMSIVGCTIGNGKSSSSTLRAGSSILTASKKSIKEAATNASKQITITGVLSYLNTESKTADFIEISSGTEYEVPYSGATTFATRYGTAIAASNLTLGEIYDVVCNKTGVATSIQGDTDSFEVLGFDNVEVNETKRKLTSGGLSYVYSEHTLVLSGSNIIPIAEVLKQDEVTLRGVGSTVYSVSVESGHGYIRFTGVDGFIGGYAQIGKEQLYDVTEGMIVTAAEGTYDVEMVCGSLSATKEVTVVRDDETTVDFGEYLQPATLQGTINFSITPAGAIMTIDGEEVDYSTPVQLSYGKHTLTLVKNLYTEYTETFTVNSSYQTKVIDMEAKSSSTTTAATTTKATTKASTTTKATTKSTTEATTSGTPVIKVTSPAGASMYVDSVYVGEVPCSFDRTEGTKTITFTQTGYNTVSYSISVESGTGDLTYAFPAMTESSD